MVEPKGLLGRLSRGGILAACAGLALIGGALIAFELSGEFSELTECEGVSNSPVEEAHILYEQSVSVQDCGAREYFRLVLGSRLDWNSLREQFLNRYAPQHWVAHDLDGDDFGRPAIRLEKESDEISIHLLVDETHSLPSGEDFHQLEDAKEGRSWISWALISGPSHEDFQEYIRKFPTVVAVVARCPQYASCLWDASNT